MQVHEPERVGDRRSGIRPGWPARALVAGFAASVVMLVAFLVAFGLAWLLSRAAFEIQGGVVSRDSAGHRYVRTEDLPPLVIPGGETVHGWLYNLTHNRLIDAATADVYIAAAIYLAGGLAWALVYAVLLEPRIPGPAWRRGLVFSIVPGILSSAAFLPLAGAGPLGAALGAGPLPVIGNLLLHMVYGVTLGQLYGPWADRDATTLEAHQSAADIAALRASDRLMVRGLGVGLVVGIGVGVAGTLLAGLGSRDAVGATPMAALMLAGALLGAALGVGIGAFLGLAGPRRTLT